MNSEEKYGYAQIIPKEFLEQITDKDGFMNYIIKKITMELANVVLNEASKGECICKFSDVIERDIPERNGIEYRKYLTIKRLIRCRECKNRFYCFTYEREKNPDFYCYHGEMD